MLRGLPSNEPMLALAPLGTQEPPACVMWVPHIDVRNPFNMINLKDRPLSPLWSGNQTPLVSTFAERTALPGDLDRVLAALFARHGRAVWLPVHALAEGAVVLLPLLLVGPQLVVHPAAGLRAVH